MKEFGHHGSESVIGMTKAACDNYKYWIKKWSHSCITDGYKLVVMGHTHVPLISKRGGLVYANSGAWTDGSKLSYVDIYYTKDNKLSSVKIGSLKTGNDLEIKQYNILKTIDINSDEDIYVEVDKDLAYNPADISGELDDEDNIIHDEL